MIASPSHALVLADHLLVAPPQLSEEEIKQMEAEANFSIQQVLVSAVLLYLCMVILLSSFYSRALAFRMPSANSLGTAPFAIDAASKVF